MTTNTALGIDPDMHHIGVAVVSRTGVEAIDIIGQSGNPRGEKAVIGMAECLYDSLATIVTGFSIDKVVVENQNLYLKGKANPGSILRLGQVAGMCVMAARMCLPEAEILMPSPQLWKGSVPKEIKHKRILASLDWHFKEVNKRIIPTVPDDLVGISQIPLTQWTHVIDAMGLAKWALR